MAGSSDQGRVPRPQESRSRRRLPRTSSRGAFSSLAVLDGLAEQQPSSCGSPRLPPFQGISQTAGESASRGFCSAAERQCVEHRFVRLVLVLSCTLVERDRDSASTATALAGRRWSLLVPSGMWSTGSGARIVPERAPWRVRLTFPQRAFNRAVLSGRARGPIWLPGLLVGRSRSGCARRRGSSARRPARTCALLSPAG